jgi:hypothetical protein
MPKIYTNSQTRRQRPGWEGGKKEQILKLSGPDEMQTIANKHREKEEQERNFGNESGVISTETTIRHWCD